MNRVLKSKCNKKRKLWFKCRNNKFTNLDDFQEYKALNKEIRGMVNQNVKAYENKIAANSKHNPKAVYSYINSKTKSKDSIKALYLRNNNNLNETNNETTTNGSQIANILNDYFVSVFTKEDEHPVINLKLETECPNPSFEESLVKEHIDKLKPHKAIGFDNVHPRVLKSCSSAVAKPLSIIFNKSYETGSYQKNG
jgi:hypothetical protein